MLLRPMTEEEFPAFVAQEALTAQKHKQEQAAYEASALGQLVAKAGAITERGEKRDGD